MVHHLLEFCVTIVLHLCAKRINQWLRQPGAPLHPTIFFHSTVSHTRTMASLSHATDTLLKKPSMRSAVSPSVLPRLSPLLPFRIAGVTSYQWIEVCGPEELETWGRLRHKT